MAKSWLQKCLYSPSADGLGFSSAATENHSATEEAINLDGFEGILSSTDEVIYDDFSGAVVNSPYSEDCS
jgi:hypothetical protein